MHRTTPAFVALLLASGVACGQHVTVSILAPDDPIPQVGESITITVRASVLDAAAFAGFWFDVTPTGSIFNPSGTASNFQFLNGLGGLSNPPTLAPGGYRGVETANFPVPFGGTTANPIDLFSFTFTRLLPRQIDFVLVTHWRSDVPGARVYLTPDTFAATSADTTLIGASLSPVPTPGSATMVALVIGAASRRRR